MNPDTPSPRAPATPAPPPPHTPVAPELRRSAAKSSGFGAGRFDPHGIARKFGAPVNFRAAREHGRGRHNG